MRSPKDLPADVREWLAELGLVSLATVIAMGKPWEALLQAWDSSIHARVSLQVAGGGFLPQLPMRHLHLDAASPVFNDHPFTLFYLAGKFMYFFGPSAWSARFVPSLFSVLSVWILFRMTRRAFGHGVAVLSCLLLMMSTIWIQMSARFQLDPAMIFWILLSFSFWMKVERPDPSRATPRWRSVILSGFAAGAAVGFKSPVGFLILPVAFLVDFGLRKNRSKAWLGAYVLLGLCSLVFPLMVWGVTASVGGVDLVRDYFFRQVLGTAVQGRGAPQPISIFYFLKVVKETWKPGLGLGVGSLGFLVLGALLGKKAEFPELRSRSFQLMGIAIGVLISVLTMIRFKYPYYFLPVFPFLSVWVALTVKNATQAWRKVFPVGGIDWSVIGMGFSAPMLLLVFPVPLAIEQFPALRKLIPYIQTYSQSGDRILYVDHAQPYGSDGDSYVELIFYTGRPYFSANCTNASSRILEKKPEWVLTSGKSIGECIRADLLTNYPFRIRAGNQYLLSVHPVPTSENAFDLTPLYRELKVSVDGEAPPLPSNQFYRY